MNTEEMLAAMKAKPKISDADKILGTDHSAIGLMNEPKTPTIDETKTLPGNLIKKKLLPEPSTNDLLVNLIGHVRRTNTLLEQLRSIALGLPLSESKSEVSENGK